MSTLHEATFEHLQPTETQLATMAEGRAAFVALAKQLDELIPEGPDRTYLLRRLREVAMWVNIAITRHADGAPRK